jgi:hypothetical protein
MPLILTEEQTMLKEAADGFLSENAPIAHLRKPCATATTPTACRGSCGRRSARWASRG